MHDKFDTKQQTLCCFVIHILFFHSKVVCYICMGVTYTGNAYAQNSTETPQTRAS